MDQRKIESVGLFQNGWQVQGTAARYWAASNLTWIPRGNQGDPAVGVGKRDAPSDKCRKRGRGQDSRKMEAPLEAMKPGTAGGAKGGRFGRTGRRNMARLRHGRAKIHYLLFKNTVFTPFFAHGRQAINILTKNKIVQIKGSFKFITLERSQICCGRYVSFS